MLDVILWNREGTSDKLWGVSEYKGRAITFWGRRNRELSFKLLTKSEQSKIDKTIDAKRNKRGYEETTFEELERETEGFKAEFDQMLLLAILGDDFKHTDERTIAG